MGILWRCLAAYCGIDFKSEADTYRNYLGLAEDSKSSSPQPPATKNGSATTTRKQFISKYDNSDQRVVFDTDGGLDVIDIEPLGMEQQPDDGLSEEQASVLKEKARLMRYHKVMGDSIFLIETLRNHQLPHNEYMSPLMSSDQLLAKFPKTCLIVSSLFFVSF
jgi:hypothetical protein